MPAPFEELRRDVLELRRAVDRAYHAERFDLAEDLEGRLEGLEEQLEAAADEWYTERNADGEAEEAEEAEEGYNLVSEALAGCASVPW